MYRYMLGGFILALNAGYVNVVALLSSYKLPVSHMTGITSNLSISLVHNRGSWRLLALLIVSFVAGSVVSGLTIESMELRFGRRYGVLLILESALLLAAITPLTQERWYGLCLLALSCGLQNGMVATYSKAIVRTSHLTGLLTDFGILIGQRLAGRQPEPWRWHMHVALFMGFLSGGVLGTWLFDVVGLQSLLVCAALTASVGFGYWLWRQRRAHYWLIGQEN